MECLHQYYSILYIQSFIFDYKIYRNPPKWFEHHSFLPPFYWGNRFSKKKCCMGGMSNAEHGK